MKISCCPHCESKEGFYSKIVLYGMRRIFYLDGTSKDLKDNIYEGSGKSIYCVSCNRLVGSINLVKKEDE